jgi:hypothetical protein
LTLQASASVVPLNVVAVAYPGIKRPNLSIKYRANRFSDRSIPGLALAPRRMWRGCLKGFIAGPSSAKNPGSPTQGLGTPRPSWIDVSNRQASNTMTAIGAPRYVPTLFGGGGFESA